MTNAELLIEFIKKCPTCFNVIDQIKVVLDNNGYKKLSLNNYYRLPKLK